MKPITPEQVGDGSKPIPDEVIQVFNDLIQKHWDGVEAVVTQNEAVTRIAELMNVSRQTIYNNRWVDVEGHYRKAGWKVEYDKPAYNEDYEATFTFRK